VKIEKMGLSDLNPREFFFKIFDQVCLRKIVKIVRKISQNKSRIKAIFVSLFFKISIFSVEESNFKIDLEIRFVFPKVKSVNHDFRKLQFLRKKF